MLENISITELKKMSNEQLESLADQIREAIIKSVSINGGHLASNLGVVELTMAIHKIFDSPKDKIIFDVSHQSYTHKILTGRYNQFENLRKFKGLSGFTRYSESVHDAYEAGHSSTAISAGLGYLEAKKEFPEEIGDVIAIVGDASIANGLSFEALNYLGAHPEQKMIIILNDNEMGISKNVGSLAKRYNEIRAHGKMRLIRKITPMFIKKALKSTFFDFGLFQSLGFQYFEKIDGHNFKELEQYLTFAKNSSQSVVLHVVTKKGKGYLKAENDQSGNWHGVGPFDIATGKLLEVDEKVSFGNIISNHLVDYVANNTHGKLVRVITPAMALGSGLESFMNSYPNQFIDVGLAEENAAVMASSMAHANLVPILFCYSTFLQRAYDEILHDIARSNEHVIICVDHAGIVSADGDTHQGIFDLAYLNSIPNLTIFSPKDANDALGMIDYAIEKVTGPVVIRYSKEKIAKPTQITKFTPNWEVIKDGNIVVITYGILVNEVNKYIEEDSLTIGLINAQILSMVDEKIFDNLVDNHKKIIVYEEVIENGSLSDTILRYCHKKNKIANIKSISLPNSYLETGSRRELMEAYHISKEDLLKVIGEEDVTKFNG